MKNKYSKSFVDFVFDDVFETSLHDDLEFISVSDAEYGLQCMREEGWLEIPEGLTAEIYTEIYNYEVAVRRLDEFIKESELVAEYAQFRSEFDPDGPDIMPTECMDTVDLNCRNLSEYYTLFKNSCKTFNPDHCYAWYDNKEKRLHSSDTPFHDGVIDSMKMALYALSDKGDDLLKDIRYNMTEEECRYVLNENPDEDDPYEIVRNVTDNDPLADLTLDDAVRLIESAHEAGYTVPESLTPEKFLDIYDQLKPEEE